VQQSSRCSIEKGYRNPPANTSDENDAQRAAPLQPRFNGNDAGRIALFGARATSSSAFNCACACSSDAFLSASSPALGDDLLDDARLHFQRARRPQRSQATHVDTRRVRKAQL